MAEDSELEGQMDPSAGPVMEALSTSEVTDDQIRTLLEMMSKKAAKEREELLNYLVELTADKDDDAIRTRVANTRVAVGDNEVGAIDFLVDLIKPTNSPVFLTLILTALIQLTRTKENRELVGKAGFAPKLVNLLKMARHLLKNSLVKQKTVQAVINMATANNKNKALLQKEGAPSALGRVMVDMDFAENDELPRHSVLAMSVMCTPKMPNAEKENVIKSGGIPPLVAALKSKSAPAVKNAISALSSLAQSHLLTKDAIAEAKGAASLVTLIGHANTAAQEGRGGLGLLNAQTGLLQIICAAHAGNCNDAVAAGAIPILISILAFAEGKEDRDAKATRTNVITAIMHITKQTPSSKGIMRDINGIPALVKMVEDQDAAVVEKATWTINNLCTRDAENQNAVRDAGAVPRLVKLLDNKELLKDKKALLKGAMAALVHLMESEENRTEVDKAGGLMAVLYHALQMFHAGVPEVDLALLNLRFLSATSQENQRIVRRTGGKELLECVREAYIASSALPYPPTWIDSFPDAETGEIRRQDSASTIFSRAETVPDDAAAAPPLPPDAEAAAVAAPPPAPPPVEEAGQRPPPRRPQPAAAPAPAPAPAPAADAHKRQAELAAERRAANKKKVAQKFGDTFKEVTTTAGGVEQFQKELEDRQRAKEEEKKRKAEEAKREAEEAERRRQEAEEAARIAKEEAEKKRQAEEAEKKRLQEERQLKEFVHGLIAGSVEMAVYQIDSVKMAKESSVSLEKTRKLAKEANQHSQVAIAEQDITKKQTAITAAQQNITAANEAAKAADAAVAKAIKLAEKALPGAPAVKEAVAAAQEAAQAAKGVVDEAQGMLAQATVTLKTKEKGFAIAQAVVLSSIETAVAVAELMYDVVKEAVNEAEIGKRKRAERDRLEKETQMRKEMARVQAIRQSMRDILMETVDTAVDSVELVRIEALRREQEARDAERQKAMMRERGIREARARLGMAGRREKTRSQRLMGGLPDEYSLDEVLVAAVLARDKEAVMYVAQEANVQQETTGGYTLLHEVAEMGELEMLEALLENGASTKALTMKGSTPLLTAAAKGRTELVRRLLSSGADPRATNHKGDTPLHVAAVRGHSETVTALLEGGASVADRDAKGNSALHAAAYSPHVASVEAILNFSLALEEAAQQVENEKRGPAKMITNGELGTPDSLTIWSKGQRASPPAKKKGSRPVERSPLFLRNQHHITPLHMAAAAGNSTATQLLVQCGAPIDVQDKAGYTPLHLAAYRGHSEVARILLTNGASTHLRTGDGHNARELACGPFSNATTRKIVNYASSCPEVMGEDWSMMSAIKGEDWNI